MKNGRFDLKQKGTRVNKNATMQPHASYSKGKRRPVEGGLERFHKGREKRHTAWGNARRQETEGEIRREKKKLGS